MEASAMTPNPTVVSGWTAEEGAAWLGSLVDDGTLVPGRALIPSAAMATEAATLAGKGFRVAMTDASKADLVRARELAAGHDVTLDTIPMDFFQMPPYLAGPVDLLYDRAVLHDLDPVLRADWTHRVGRILVQGGHLAAIFLIGRSPSGPPYPITLDALKQGLGRMFVVESLEPVGPADPGRSRAYRGLFLRK
jgi:hypothetical protein